MLSALSIATAVSTSETHSNFPLWRSRCAYTGSRGSLAISLPYGVRSDVSSSSALRALSNAKADSTPSSVGGVRNPKLRGSCTPIPLSWRTTWARFTLSISGVAFSASPSKWSSVYSRRHRPGPTRPARPVRWAACALLTSATDRLSIPVEERYSLDLCRPQSTTNLTPSSVTDVSAMFVARMTFRCTPSGLGRKARSCCSGGSDAYRTQMSVPSTIRLGPPRARLVPMPRMSCTTSFLFFPFSALFPSSPSP
mmetsp:Transcript_9799/g.22942  ORF Transcript_9799/g.22942 Transcript_9799/m.22942 type:complete len:253 (-) Transcript_9799:745-1503(-)